MKLLGTDFSAKYIILEINGKSYIVQFRDNIRKGVHDVKVWSKDGEVKVKVTGTYPPLKEIFVELWILLSVWLKRIIKGQ